MQLKKKNIHFIGIGGIGMCGLAELLYNSGCQVTGSDLEEGSEVLRLRKLGIPIFIGHSSSYVDAQTDIVVYSSAIKEDNVEREFAKKKGLPVIHRVEALAEMMRLKQGIVVSGVHGKTTTTAFLASVFFKGGKNPTVVAGGRLDLFGSTAHLGKSKWFIAESDESDGSFHHLFPELIILTNIDGDHLDFYGSLEEIKKSFKSFLKKLPFYGAVIACGDCPHVRDVLKDLGKKCYFYGFSKENDFVLKKQEESYIVEHEKTQENDFVLKKQAESYVVEHEKTQWLEFEPPLKGDYNALNALGAMICGTLAGIKKEELLKGINSFKGVKRRREFKGSYKDCLVYDDYAHHPTELKALLKSMREEFKTRRLLAVFQPHRYTRFRNSWDAFLESFVDSDLLYVLPVYPAGEPAIKNIHSENFIKKIKHPEAYFVKEEDLLAQLCKKIQKGDVILTLGAGSIYKYGEKILKALAHSTKSLS